MEKTDRSLRPDDAIARVEPFTITPPARCFTQVGPESHHKCGELATARRRGNRWFGDSFHCDDHRDETDVDISGAWVGRRVLVTCDVYLSGTDERAGAAQAEAVARLGAAVTALGGVLDVKMTTSQTRRYPAARGAGEAPTTSGSPE